MSAAQVATPRFNPTLAPKMNLATAMRQRAIAMSALERIAVLGGPASVAARDVLERLRKEVSR